MAGRVQGHRLRVVDVAEVVGEADAVGDRRSGEFGADAHGDGDRAAVWQVIEHERLFDLVEARVHDLHERTAWRSDLAVGDDRVTVGERQRFTADGRAGDLDAHRVVLRRLRAEERHERQARAVEARFPGPADRPPGTAFTRLIEVDLGRRRAEPAARRLERHAVERIRSIGYGDSSRERGRLRAARDFLRDSRRNEGNGGK